MKALPDGLQAYRRTPEFDETTTPPALRRRHDTKAGVWGRIVVLEGSLVYRILEPSIEEHTLDPERSGVVEPGIGHELSIDGPVRFYVEFMRARE